MSQQSWEIYTGTTAPGSTTMPNIKDALRAAQNMNAEATEPSYKEQGTWWYDTGNDLIKWYDGSAWITMFKVDEAGDDAVPVSRGVPLDVEVVAFADADATPSVSGGISFETANTGSTTITDFDDGKEGQVITIRAADANTTIGAALMKSGVATLLSSGDVLQFTYDGSAWQQIISSAATSDDEEAFTANDATPSVSGGNHFRTANTSSTTITGFDDGTTGQQITIRIDDANTTIDSGLTATGMEIPCLDGDTLSFVYDGAAWQQIAGSVGMGVFVALSDADAIGDWPASSTGSPTDVDVSDDGVRKGASVVCFRQYLYLNGSLALNVRPNGSSDTADATTLVARTSTSAIRQLAHVVVPLDDDAIFEAWFSNTGSATVNTAAVVGYWI